MENRTPAASVVIQTFNRSNILGDIIASVLAQTRADFEVIVVGDACDDTANVVARPGRARTRMTRAGSERAAHILLPNANGQHRPPVKSLDEAKADAAVPVNRRRRFAV